MAAYTLHILTTLDATAALAIDADRRDGREVHLVLLHDQVALAGSDRLPACDRLLVGADDCRRRGLPLSADAVEYPEIVDAIAAAAKVISW